MCHVLLSLVNHAAQPAEEGLVHCQNVVCADTADIAGQRSHLSLTDYGSVMGEAMEAVRKGR